jgi:predicted Zn-dependent protease
MRKKHVQHGRPLCRMPSYWWRGLLGVCLATVVAGCAVNPVSGRSEVAVISAEKERELGAEEARKVETGMGLVADPALVAYVQAVGARVAQQSPRQDISYTFQIVNQSEPNAFALPNGNIYLSRDEFRGRTCRCPGA